jgi:hemerythrin
MKKTVKIWDLSSKSYIEDARLIDSKSELKKIIANNTSLIGKQSLIIQQDYEVSSGKYIDFLTIDKNGNLTIIQSHSELSASDIIHRLIDYASLIQYFTYGQVKSLYEMYHKHSFEKAVKDTFGQFQNDFNKQQFIILISNSLSITSDRIFKYLTNKFKLPINVVTFEHFTGNSGNFIIQNWYKEPQEFYTDSMISTEKENLIDIGRQKFQEYQEEQEKISETEDISANLENLLNRLKADKSDTENLNQQSITDNKVYPTTNQHLEIPSLEEVLKSFIEDVHSNPKEIPEINTDKDIEELLKSYFNNNNQANNETSSLTDIQGQQIEKLTQENNTEIEDKETDSSVNTSEVTQVNISETESKSTLEKLLSERQNKIFHTEQNNIPTTWDNAYALGISEIDNQHKILFSIYDEFVQAFNNEKSSEHIKTLLEKLDSFRIFHFETEENMMIKLKYDLYEQHYKEHQFFAKTIAEFAQHFKYGNKVLVNEIIGFLKKWFISHISGSDVLFKDYIVEQGYSLEKISAFLNE